MSRPKKKAPNRKDQRYEKKISIGKNINGKPIRKSFYSTISMNDVDEQILKYRTSLAVSAATGIPSAALGYTPVSFTSAANMFLSMKKGRVKENTYEDTYKRTVEKFLIPFFGKSSLSNINAIDIDTFYKHLSEKYAETTLKKCRLCLNAIFDLSVDNGLCLKNPSKRVSLPITKSPINKRVLSENDVKEILEFADTHKDGIYIRILFELGLRCEELCGLKWSDFNFNDKTVSILRAVTGFNGKATIGETKSKSSRRILPLSTELSIKLKNIKGSNNDFILSTSTGKLYYATYFTVRKFDPFWNDFAEYRIKNDLPEIQKITPHECRHTCGTLLYEKTHDIYAVSKYLGHSSVEITSKIYVHDSPELLRNSLKIV